MIVHRVSPVQLLFLGMPWVALIVQPPSGYEIYSGRNGQGIGRCRFLQCVEYYWCTQMQYQKLFRSVSVHTSIASSICSIQWFYFILNKKTRCYLDKERRCWLDHGKVVTAGGNFRDCLLGRIKLWLTLVTLCKSLENPTYYIVTCYFCLTCGIDPKYLEGHYFDTMGHIRPLTMSLKCAQYELVPLIFLFHCSVSPGGDGPHRSGLPSPY